MLSMLSSSSGAASSRGYASLVWPLRASVRSASFRLRPRKTNQDLTGPPQFNREERLPDQRYAIARDEPWDRKHALRIDLVEPTPDRTRPPQINPE